VEVPRPRLDAVDAPVRAAIEARLAAARGAKGDADVAKAHGDLGMLLLAAEFFDSAVPSLRNAATLAPNEPRWPYYLAHAYRRLGDLSNAAHWFERMLSLDAEHAAASWWLATAYVDLNRAADAERLFARTRERAGLEVASLYGLGRAALAQGRFADAAAYLEQTLAHDAAASAARYPLGLAYQRLGRPEEAEAHLRARRGGEIRPPDAWLGALDALVDSSLAYHSRGVAASAAGDWVTAATDFRRAVELDPEEASAHMNLSVALHRLGQDGAALVAAQRALELRPRDARGLVVVGTALVSMGRTSEALRAFEDAVRADPQLPLTRLALADFHRQAGRDADASREYRQALELAPDLADARFGAALSAVRLGRVREARDLVADGMASHADEPRFSHALARILATATEPDVRDASRAIALSQALLDAQPSVDRATTMAMAQAAAGRFQDAAEWQRRAIVALTDSDDDTRRARAAMQRNLARFERGQPVRQPWPDDDPIHRPLSSALPGVVE
jgi:tetratricopeptide (TPR) repeat protein